MKTFDNIYDFYELTDEEAAKFVSTFIAETVIYKKKRYPDRLYFVIGLENKWENYGKPFGLLSIQDVVNVDNLGFFRISMFTPDDGDLSLDFEGTTKDLQKLRKQIINYLGSMHFDNTYYKEVLLLIKNEFNLGKIEY